MIKKSYPLLTIKKENPDGSEETIQESPYMGTPVLQRFPKNITNRDIKYNIYYDDGNGCTAKESIIVPSGSTCYRGEPIGPIPVETCIINVKCNTTAPDSITYTISNNQGYSKSTDPAKPKTTYTSIDVSDSLDKDSLTLTADAPGWAVMEVRNVSCGGEYEVKLNKTVYIIAVNLKNQSLSSCKVGRFEIHETFREEYLNPSNRIPTVDLFGTIRGPLKIKFKSYIVKNGFETLSDEQYVLFETRNNIKEKNLDVCPYEDGFSTYYDTSSVKFAPTDASNFTISSDGKQITDTINGITYILKIQNQS